jgi:hypothetical protein
MKKVLDILKLSPYKYLPVTVGRSRYSGCSLITGRQVIQKVNDSNPLN